MANMSDWYVGIDMSAFAERLRLLREARKMSQVRLAELLEVDPRTYNRWEKGGNPPLLETVIKIADVLQVSLDELVGRKAITTELKIHNKILHDLCQQADVLPDIDQQALILVLDSFVKKAQIERVINSGKS
ncbi:helix-turn-helix domain-containing protein [Serratia microhaemolytica]|uniref:helix-turn-helix domain-containing protein n=1 Tax=Serratia microhaemolytica TaxID=2675110 RepID=UPI000FDD9BB9|nr:helix-turn-helix transcriptional regulator [Serratia microhaemolytica]